MEAQRDLAESERRTLSGISEWILLVQYTFFYTSLPVDWYFMEFDHAISGGIQFEPSPKMPKVYQKTWGHSGPERANSRIWIRWWSAEKRTYRCLYIAIWQMFKDSKRLHIQHVQGFLSPYWPFYGCHPAWWARLDSVDLAPYLHRMTQPQVALDGPDWWGRADLFQGPLW